MQKQVFLKRLSLLFVSETNPESSLQHYETIKKIIREKESFKK